MGGGAHARGFKPCDGRRGHWGAAAGSGVGLIAGRVGGGGWTNLRGVGRMEFGIRVTRGGWSDRDE